MVMLAAASFVFATIAAQVHMRRGSDIAKLPRWLAIIIAAFDGGWIGIEAVNALYLAGMAPAIDWRGALWIGAVLIGAALAGLILYGISIFPEEPEPIHEYAPPEAEGEAQ